MPNTESITQPPQRFKYHTLRSPKTHLRYSPMYLEYLADEHYELKKRVWKREKHLLSVVEIEFQGELIKASVNGLKDRPQLGTGRGRITMFSPKARKNMLDTVSRIDWTGTTAQFITLTYHSNMIDAARAKRDLRAFQKRLYRREGNYPTLWKLEPQKRGAWHFHLICFGMPYVKTSDILKHWREVTGEATITQVKIEPIQSAKKARSYCAKYLGKPIETLALRLLLLVMFRCPEWLVLSLALDYLPNLAATHFPGRFWGIENRKNMRYAALTIVTVVIDESFYDLKRAARRKWSGINGNKRAGFTLYSQNIGQWHEYLFYLIGEEEK